MKLLVLTHELPPVGGGGGRAAYDICKELAKHNHEITIITAHIKGLPHNELVQGFRIVRIPCLRKELYRAPLITMIAYVIAGLWVGLRFIVKNKPDRIHAHFAVPAGALAFLLSFFTGVPYILTAHLGDVPGGVPEKTDKWFVWIKPFTHVIWKGAKAVVAVSEYTRHLALKHYSVQIKVIKNGVDLSSLNSIKMEVHRPIQIIFAGRFVPQKNPVAVVQILSNLKELPWFCAMLGDGPLFENVKKEIIKCDLQDRFDLPGWVSSEDVLERISKSDILFMPSLAEGLPVVGVHALAMGLAFVVSDIGGFVDLVDESKNGYLIETRSYVTFVDALKKLISDPQTLLKYRRSSLKMAEQFDISKVAQAYEEILL